jgi:2-polyprenyl-6-methoxyphenol hydroxylase-like FAD-dependent oxidoreductase
VALRNQRILISGAGIAGPALAFWLARYGFSPTLIERAPAFRDSGYMIDVWGVGYDLLARMNLLKEAKAQGYLIDNVWFVDERGRRVSGFDARLFRSALSDRFFSIPRGDLARLIHETLPQNIETRYSTSIARLAEDPSGVEVEFERGGTERFDLVIGADGLRSRVRECAFGPNGSFEKYLGYYVASFITTGYPHRDESTYLSFAKPGRQISRYAMRGDRSAFLFVFAEETALPAMHGLADQKALLNVRFGQDGWETPEILARLETADELYFDSVSQIRMSGWSKGRVALLGDAAYCPSLLAGAGSAFAMLGAYILAGELHKADGNHDAVFAAYERRMRPFIETQQRNAAGFASSFAPKTRFGLFVRDRVLDLTRLRPLAAWTVRRMFDAPFDLPDYV